MGNIHTVGPNEALVISGGFGGSTKKTIIIGGWAWAWWFITDVQRLSLQVMTLNPVCKDAETAQGVPLNVTGVTQCKIHTGKKEFLEAACEQFLGKSPEQVKATILQTMEGHLRAILGTLSVEEIYQDCVKFATLVREVAAPDVGRMGIEILSFTIKGVYDDVGYLSSLGKAQAANVKRDAAVGVAQANRDAGIQEAECEKAALDVKYNMEAKVADNTRLYHLQRANYDREIQTAKAEAAMAHGLQTAKTKQQLCAEQLQVTIIERRKQIEIEEQEIVRKKKELTATVKLQWFLPDSFQLLPAILRWLSVLFPCAQFPVPQFRFACGAR